MADYKKIIPLIRQVEGGLSASLADEAHKDPVPDGSGYHTNKGITWTAFKDSAIHVGYMATPSLFYKMPDDIWEGIFKKMYWDQVRADEIESQAIADTLVDWAWASGPGAAVHGIQKFMKITADGAIGPFTLGFINRLAKGGERLFNDEFSAFKLNWYLSLDKQPGDGKGFELNYEGWKSRLAKVHTFTNSEIKP